MRAAVMYEVNKPLVIEDVTVNKPGPHEVLIRTAYAGLCHSDLHFIEGLYPHPLPVVLGHESAGIVEQVGSEVHLRAEGRPRHHLPVGVLRHLRVLHQRPARDLQQRRRQAGAGHRPAPQPEAASPSTPSPTCRRSPSRCWCTSTPS